MYPAYVTFTLIGMITAGAGRIVAVKIYYQIELDEGRKETPFFITLLYLAGQALSLLVHFIHTRLKCNCRNNNIINKDCNADYSTVETTDMSVDVDNNENVELPEKNFADEDFETIESADDKPMVIKSESNNEHSKNCNENILKDYPKKIILHCNSGQESGTGPMTNCRPLELKRQGSDTGLTFESQEAVAWVHRIPWYLRPAIPGLFNLCNSALRWACLVYIAASTAEILISGLELVLSSFAARILRKRIISTRRWFGVFFVTLGIITVGFIKVKQKQDDETEEKRFFIGNILIVGQCLFSVLQDLSEEIFMQEANFPATLLLGMEGVFGLVFGIPLYFFFASEQITLTRFNIEYEIFLVILVMITGILNIRTTKVTSSMTRNVWKQFRIMLVWALGLFVYYIGSADKFGEQWIFPGSLYVLGGFSIILLGVYFYYSD